ncbi:MAG: DUF3025 domain-containing protein [Azoarcus sp.]|nr:DUF3025 domain-containing protein [Azoarcus sp.]
MTPHPESPATLAARSLFEPIAPWLERFPGSRLPDASALTALLREVAPHARTASGQPLRFEHTGVVDGYEARIDASGVVPTRRDDWHDFFNALSWCAWPAAKAALNAAHTDEIAARRAAGLAGRGRRRDALTQFDECGMVVVSCDPCVPTLLASHAWEAVFVTRRAALPPTTRFFVVGHASWEALRSPFVGLCAKAVHRVVSEDWLAQDETAQRQELDCWLACLIADRHALATPRSLRPLPLCGIPGVTPENESPAYYRDTRQFRPRRAT